MVAVSGEVLVRTENKRLRPLDCATLSKVLLPRVEFHLCGGAIQKTPIEVLDDTVMIFAATKRTEAVSVWLIESPSYMPSKDCRSPNR